MLANFLKLLLSNIVGQIRLQIAVYVSLLYVLYSMVWKYDLVGEEQGGQEAALGVHVLLPHGDLVEGAGPREVRHHDAALQHGVTLHHLGTATCLATLEVGAGQTPIPLLTCRVRGEYRSAICQSMKMRCVYVYHTSLSENLTPTAVT